MKQPIENSARKALLMLLCAGFISGCQLVKLQPHQLSASLADKTDNILTNHQLSQASRSLLLLIHETPDSCLSHVEACVGALQTSALDSEQVYAAASELYLARAIAADRAKACSGNSKHAPAHPESGKIKACLNQQLEDFNKALRYSYVYLFKTEHAPEARVFDLRQGQVRTFYNLALSRLITSSYARFNYAAFPESLALGSARYNFDFTHYPAIQQAQIEQLKSSYNLNFSGFYSINRQEGLGSEFVLVKKPPANAFSAQFILDPEQHYRNMPNPNIHEARYLSVSAIASPENPALSAEQILSDETPLTIRLFDPYSNKTAQVNGTAYTLTANYSVPYGLWLSENKLGKSGYLTLLNREQNLHMPHLFMLEPYQPDKKIIVMIHGLASSPETWISLTNNIMGDEVLRAHYQVWQVFYSTNMPIFESRFQINALLKQAFAKVDLDSPSAQNAVLIGHSMGGIISRLLVSDADISAQAIPLMNYEQNIQLQRNPVIRERFIFKPLPQVSRAIFIAAPHRGTAYADRWFTNVAKKLVVLPKSFFSYVNVQVPNLNSSSAGLVRSGPEDLSRTSRFMALTSNLMPRAGIPYHSIIGNKTRSNAPDKMADGIVPYSSSHLAGAESETVISGSHSIHETPEAILELRRILRGHLNRAEK